MFMLGFRYKLNLYFSTLAMQLYVPAFLKNTYQFELETKVAQVKQDKVMFEDTIFHPQGGGQPDDKGSVFIGENQFQVTGTAPQRQTGKIYYKFASLDQFKEGQKVLMKIDKEVRVKNAQLHSAGHLIDLAVQRLKYPWEGAKGYHFPDAPYVQYKGKHQNLEQAAKQINEQISKLLSQDIKTQKQVFSYQQAVQKGLIPETFKVAIVRMVAFGQSRGPCGGTHIEHVKDMNKLTIPKIQKKSKNVRVYYQI